MKGDKYINLKKKYFQLNNYIYTQHKSTKCLGTECIAQCAKAYML